jgi:hypothetical protein
MVPVAGVDDLDFEGVLTGFVDGHYVLQVARIVQGEQATYSLDNVVEIPAGRVWWLERLQGVSV